MKASNILLKDQLDNDFSLQALNTSYIVLYFYPKDMTSGCSQQAQNFRDKFAAFQALDCTIVGVSPDSVKRHQKFIETYDLPFTLLADTEHKAAEDYGVWQEKSMYGKKYFGIVRSTFLLNNNLDILQSWNKVSVKGHVDNVYAALEGINT